MTTKKLSSFKSTQGVVSNQNVVNNENVYKFKSLTRSKEPNSGGIIIRANGYVYHVFKESGVFTLNNDTKPVDILLVGGGGSGGLSIYGGSGGGGAGGVQYLNQKFLKAGQYAVAIGAGGIDGNGSNTTFHEYTALGGGQGGTSGYGLVVTGQAKYGASGGGGANHNGANSANMTFISEPNEPVDNWATTDFPWLTTMWSPTALGLQPRSRYGGKGNRGGAANNGGWRITTNTWVLFRSGSAGGGGAGDVGANALYHTGTKTTTTGAGGPGTSDYSSMLLDVNSLDIGENVSGIRYIAAGGGGGLHHYSINVVTNGDIVGMFGTIPAGAYGGGGRGGQQYYIQNTTGKANSGSGGGGGSGAGMWAAAGGSGVVIIRYSEKVY